MKAKISLGDGGIKGLLARHVEKILFALTLLLAFMLAWGGLKKRAAIANAKQASDVKRSINEATSHIDQVAWDGSFRNRDVEKNFRERAKETQKQVEVARYSLPQLLSPPPLPPSSRRIDPELYPALDLHVVSGYGAHQKPVERGIDGMGIDGMGGRPPTRRNRRLEAENAMFGIGRVDEEGTRPLPMGHPATRGGADMGRLGAGAMMGGEDLESVFFASVTALVPYKTQFENFQTCFPETNRDFDPNRDRPNYLAWELQRALITDPSAEPQWKLLKRKTTSSNAQVGSEMIMSGPAGEVIDQRYRHDLLTQPMPNLLLRDLDRYGRHPEVPRATNLGMYGLGEQENATELETEEADEEQEFMPGIQGGQMGLGGGGYGGGYRGGGIGGYQGAGEMGFEGGMAMYGGRGFGQSRLPDFLMFRYVDLEVEPGKAYRYRLRLWVEDPNQPGPGKPTPAARSLDQSVKDRLAKLPKRKVNDPTTGAKIKLPQFWRLAEWSEPSSIVRISLGHKMLVGTATPQLIKTIRGEGQSLRYRAREPSAQMMVLQWDREHIANLPAEKPMPLGGVGYLKQDTELLDGQRLKKLEDYRFTSTTVVVDIGGGEELGKLDLTAPGEVLIWNAQGDLIVLDELNDAEEFALFHYEPEPRKRPDRDDPRGERGEGEGLGAFGDENGGSRGRGGGRGRGR